MDKALFAAQFKTEQEVAQETDKIWFETKKGKFYILESGLDIFSCLMSGWAILAGWQYKLGENGMIETCFVIYDAAIKQMKSVEVKLLNHKNQMGILVFKGYDKKWAFIYEIPFDISSEKGLYQLINLYNQDNLYFHTYRDGIFYKTIIQKNLFKGLKDIEDLLLLISENNLKFPFDVERGMRGMEVFYSEYSKEEIACFIKEREQYIFLH